MPCYTTTNISVADNVGNWNRDRWESVQRENPEFYNLALRTDGTLTARSTSEAQGKALIEKARQSYAAQTIKDAAKRFSWRSTAQTTTDAGHIQLTLLRR